MPRLILSSAKVSFWGLDIIFLSPIFICPSLFRFILIWPFLLLLFRFSFKHFSIRKMQEACRADPSPSQEHKQSISVYPEGWDSAFFTSPIYSLQISIRVSEQSSSCTCSHIATPCLKKNRKVRQKNTPHCSLSYRTPAIENHHKDYGNTMCCACKPPGAHAALHPQAVRSTRLPLEHLTPLHTKPNAKLAPKSIRSLITLTGAEREMLSSYQRDSTSGEPSDGDHCPPFSSTPPVPSPSCSFTAAPPPEAAFRSGPRLRPPVTTDSVSKLHVSATVYLLNRRCSSSFKTSLPARINTAGPQNRIYLKTFSNSTEPLTLNTVKNTLQRRSGKHCSPIRGSAPGIFPDKNQPNRPRKSRQPPPRWLTSSRRLTTEPTPAAPAAAARPSSSARPRDRPARSRSWSSRPAPFTSTRSGTAITFPVMFPPRQVTRWGAYTALSRHAFAGHLCLHRLYEDPTGQW